MSTERPTPHPNQGAHAHEHPLACCATSKPAKTPELVVPEAVRPPSAAHALADSDPADPAAEESDGSSLRACRMRSPRSRRQTCSSTSIA